MITKSLLTVIVLGAYLGSCSPHTTQPSETTRASQQPALTQEIPDQTHKVRGAYIAKTDYITCFPEGTLQADGSPATAEISGVIHNYKQGNQLFLANDKPIPGKSPIFSIMSGADFPGSSFFYFTQPAIVNQTKYEDMAGSPSGKYGWACTGFDRIREDGTWDKYNGLVYWMESDPEEIHVINSPADAKHSTHLRQPLSRALATDAFPGGMPYFKIEGLAELPGQRLLFGVRTHGASYDNAEYVVKILETSYHQLPNGKLEVHPEFSVSYTLDATAEARDLNHPVGLSSLMYSPEYKGLFMLTSYEHNDTDEGVGGYLWFLSLEDYVAQRPAKLIRTADGSPLHFAHKPEGVAHFDEKSLIIVHDDDRITGRAVITDSLTQFSRKLNQSAYSIVVLEQGL